MYKFIKPMYMYIIICTCIYIYKLYIPRKSSGCNSSPMSFRLKACPIQDFPPEAIFFA